ncbi:hypothetical protein TWF192_006902 [Orbilia oligospora]|uniref:Uncharacterized protein n=1 Tax=Orbilia oligospora TaxID=2813651 RepID=A0A6G1M5F2_ORBOL|nr:hypothetical protein TWF191_010556 [Orbilia oligospora]KAF3246388.1 hypothetical protein TWF192_006902 [Orbilia oligospora]
MKFNKSIIKVRDIGSAVLENTRAHVGDFMKQAGDKIKGNNGKPPSPGIPSAEAGNQPDVVQGFDNQGQADGISQDGSSPVDPSDVDGGVSQFSMQTLSPAASFGAGSLGLETLNIEVDESEIDMLQGSITTKTLLGQKYLDWFYQQLENRTQLPMSLYPQVSISEAIYGGYQPQGPHELYGSSTFGIDGAQSGGEIHELASGGQSERLSEYGYLDFWQDTPDIDQEVTPNSKINTPPLSSSTTVAKLPKDIGEDLRHEDPLLNRRFLVGAWRMLKKLRIASKHETASPQMRAFVDSLGGLDNIIRVGLSALKSILDGNIPTEITQVYCFLHVAYAISRAEKNAKGDDLLPSAFRNDLEIFRNCLPSTSEAPDQPTQQDIFDEIVKVVWKEVQRAVEWTGSFLGKDLSGQLRDSIKVDVPVSTGSATNKGPPGRVRKARPKVPRKAALVMEKSLQGISPGELRLLLSPPGAFNKSLSTTIDQIINSTIFQGILNTVTISSDMHKTIEYELRFPTTEDASDCVFCGDPHSWGSGCPTCDTAIQRVTQSQVITLKGLYDQVTEELKKTKGNTGLVVPWLPTPPTNPVSNNTTPMKSRPSKKGDFVCSVPNCTRGPWVNKQSLDQHMKGFHSPKPQAYLVCGFNGCTAKRGHKGGMEKALDNMRTHKRENNHFTPEELVNGTFGLTINVRQ